MPTWKLPPTIKILEALGAVADERVKVDGNTAKVYSSSLGKYYTVVYDPATNSISSNDNGSYWQKYLGYPALAFLMVKGEIPYDSTLVAKLQAIKWKDLNVKNNNNYQQTITEIYKLREFKVDEKKVLADLAKRIIATLMEKQYQILEPLPKPPSGY